MSDYNTAIEDAAKLAEETAAHYQRQTEKAIGHQDGRIRTIRKYQYYVCADLAEGIRKLAKREADDG